MLELEVLVLEALTLYAFTSSAISLFEVASLDHEILNQSMENASFLVQWFSALAHPLISFAQTNEIVNSLRDIIFEQFDLNAFWFLITNLDIKLDPRVSGIRVIALLPFFIELLLKHLIVYSFLFQLRLPELLFSIIEFLFHICIIGLDCQCQLKVLDSILGKADMNSGYCSSIQALHMLLVNA